MSDHQRLARDYARALDDFVTDERLQKQRNHLIASHARAARPRIWVWVVGSGVVVACALIVLAVFRPAPEPAGLEFRVGQKAGRTGDPIVAGTQGVKVEFDDGTTLNVESGTRATVTRATRRQVRVRLGRGRLGADVVRRQLADWGFAAGPYVVAVVGTSLSIDWNEEQQALRVEVSRGEVLVTGDRLPIAGVAVRAGERFRADVGERHRSVDEQERPSSAEVSSPKPGKRRHPADWQRLANAGKYEAALAAARRRGFDELIRTSSARQLSKLADVARYARSFDEAERALVSLHQRFPRSAEGRGAAFLIGRLMLDRGEQPRQAAEWLNRYLSTNPDGYFVEEARGRLLVALRRAGQWTEARVAAQTYLENHPTGSYVRLARATLEDD